MILFNVLFGSVSSIGKLSLEKKVYQVPCVTEVNSGDLLIENNWLLKFITQLEG